MRIYANAWPFLVAHRTIQPAIGFELMRIVSPEVFITAIPPSVIHLKCVHVDGGTHRLYAATDITISVPLGTGTSLIISPDSVRIGLESGRISSCRATLKEWAVVGWTLNPSCEGMR